MNAIRDFFMRHGAVRANERGPDLERTPDDWLLNALDLQQRTLRRHRVEGTEAHPNVKQYYQELAEEVARRVPRPDASEEILAAYLGAKVWRTLLLRPLPEVDFRGQKHNRHCLP